MPDGTVRGVFELDGEQGIRSLHSIRDAGAEADASLQRLGSRIDTVGTKSRQMATKVSETWGSARRSIEQESDRIETRIDRLQTKLDRFGATNATAKVELNGFDKVNAQISELEARLNKLSRQRATPSVALGGGFSNFAGGGGGGAASAAGGGMGFGGKLALGALGLSPGILGLAGGATALAGSATSAALGAGTVGIGGLGAGLIGGGLTALAVKPTISALQSLTKAQDAYTKAVATYGRTSSQAATAQLRLNSAIAANPAAAGASRQLSLLRGDFKSSFAGAQAQVYRGESAVFYNARRALPALGADATIAAGATSNAAISFSKFLTNPQSMTMVRQLTSAFASDLPLAEKALEHMTATLGHLAVAATPFFHQGLVWVDKWTAGLASASSNTTRVQSKMQGYVDSAKDWARLTGAAFRTIRDIFNAGAPSGDSMVMSLTHTLDRWDAWIKSNPQKVQSFFRQAEETTGKIATALVTIVRDIAQLAGYLTPIFNRAMDFLQFVGGMGPGGAGVLGALALGGYQGARGALGGRGPSAAGLAGSFIVGSPMMGRGGRVAGGVPVGGGAAQAALGTERAASYLRPPAGFQAAATAGLGTAEQVALFGMLGAGKFGGKSVGHTLVPGSGLPVSQVGELPFAARTGILSRGAGVVGGALSSAARFALPLVAISSLLQAGSTPGGIGKKLIGGVDAGASLLTLGLLGQHPVESVAGALGFHTKPTTIATSPQASGEVRRFQSAASRVSSAAGLAHYNATVGLDLNIPGNLTSQQQLKLQNLWEQAGHIAAQNAGTGSANSWADAFQRGLTRLGPQKAVKQMVAGMSTQLKHLGPEGAKSFAKSTAQWVGQLEAENPKLRRPLSRLMQSITDDVNQMHDHTLGKLHDMQTQVFYFNGQILTGTNSTWGTIRDSLIDKASVAQEKLAGIWGQIQSDAINALTQMGFSQSQAKQIVTASTAGGSAASLANTAVRGKASGTIVGSAVSTVATSLLPTATALQKTPKHKATGGMVAGRGLLDSVQMGDSMVAPGEAWIANRHTMNTLSSATLAKFGKTAWEMIRDENRQHSAPEQNDPRRRPKSGIMGGLALGGFLSGVSNALNVGIGTATNTIANASGGPVGSMPGMIGEANRIAAKNYPYSWGGGHNSSFSGPYDCSGAVSAVLHAGGALAAPEVAQWFMSYGLPGPGEVTVYASPGHTYMNLAGHGFGTSTSNPGGGANWFSAGPRPGFVERHINTTGAAAGFGTSFGAGGGAGGGYTPISLHSPASGLGGVPGAMADQAGRMYAGGLQKKVNDKLAKMAPAGGISSAGWTGGGSAGANQKLGRQMMMAAGWGADQWPALLALWNQESGWNANAVNPSSGAAGIPQALGHGNVFPLGNAPAQIAWGLNYIKGRYGSPVAAEAHEQAFNWYQRGGKTHWGGWNARGADFLTNGPTLFGAGEGGRRERVSVTPANTPTGRGHQINVNFNGPVSITSEKDIEAIGREVAAKIIQALDAVQSGHSDKHLLGMGAGHGG